MDEPSTYEKDTREKVNEQKVDFKDNIRELWKELNILKNRLPVWANFLFMLLSGTIGWLAKGKF